MSKNLLCKFGLHKWKVVDILYADWDWTGDSPLAKNKICLRCRKKHEGIKLYNEKQQEKERLEQLAKELWNKNGN